ncbi:TPA: hypothetical protein ACX6S7_000678 [Photobacterium damselae]
MIKAKFREDGSECSTEDYAQNPNKYRGLINCIECSQKAWYIKGFETDKMSRMACFGARHLDGCNASTVDLKSEAIDDNIDDPNSPSSSLYVDLDKSAISNIYVSQDNDKHGGEESTRQSPAIKQTLGNSSGYPLNKTLRGILTNLIRNPNYGENGLEIKIVSNGGRTIIDGKLKDNVINIKNISKEHTGHEYIFWGPINNLNIDKKGVLWLNYGDYRTEPSIRLDSELSQNLIKNFKLKDVSELDGSDFIIVGHLGYSSAGKAIISTSFTKYISFRKMNISKIDDTLEYNSQKEASLCDN